jgi:hypothetical protein
VGLCPDTAGVRLRSERFASFLSFEQPAIRISARVINEWPIKQP